MSASFDRRSTAEQVTDGIDLHGKTVMITGVNSGLGFESLRVLAARGAHVIGAARTLEAAEAACARVGGRTTPVACELSDLGAVRACVDQVRALGCPLDVLMCNAGIMALAERTVKHGLELQFLTNHLGHFVLANGLIDPLAQARGRLVMLSSDGHRHTPKGGIDFDNLDASRGYDAWRFYGQSKLANILFANDYARRHAARGITANSVHPGVIRTNLSRHAAGAMYRVISFFANFVERSVAQGAATQCFVATHPSLAGTSGRYFSDCRAVAPSVHAGDAALGARLWSVSEELAAKA